MQDPHDAQPSSSLPGLTYPARPPAVDCDTTHSLNYLRIFRALFLSR